MSVGLWGSLLGSYNGSCEHCPHSGQCLSLAPTAVGAAFSTDPSGVPGCACGGSGATWPVTHACEISRRWGTRALAWMCAGLQGVRRRLWVAWRACARGVSDMWGAPRATGLASRVLGYLVCVLTGGMCARAAPILLLTGPVSCPIHCWWDTAELMLAASRAGC